MFAQAPDEAHNRGAVSVALVALVLFLGGTLWAWLEIAARAPSGVPQTAYLPSPPAPRPPEQGMVYQFLFERHWQVPPPEASKTERLSRWGFTDRARGRIHMPIERAMELYLERNQ